MSTHNIGFRGEIDNLDWDFSDIGKLYRPRSDAAEDGVSSGSALLALITGS